MSVSHVPERPPRKNRKRLPSQSSSSAVNCFLPCSDSEGETSEDDVFPTRSTRPSVSSSGRGDSVVALDHNSVNASFKAADQLPLAAPATGQLVEIDRFPDYVNVPNGQPYCSQLDCFNISNGHLYCNEIMFRRPENVHTSVALNAFDESISDNEDVDQPQLTAHQIFEQAGALHFYHSTMAEGIDSILSEMEQEILLTGSNYGEGVCDPRLKLHSMDGHQALPVLQPPYASYPNNGGWDSNFNGPYPPIQQPTIGGLTIEEFIHFLALLERVKEQQQSAQKPPPMLMAPFGTDPSLADVSSIPRSERASPYDNILRLDNGIVSHHRNQNVSTSPTGCSSSSSSPQSSDSEDESYLDIHDFPHHGKANYPLTILEQLFPRRFLHVIPEEGTASEGSQSARISRTLSELSDLSMAQRWSVVFDDVDGASFFAPKSELNAPVEAPCCSTPICPLSITLQSPDEDEAVQSADLPKVLEELEQPTKADGSKSASDDGELDESQLPVSVLTIQDVDQSAGDVEVVSDFPCIMRNDSSEAIVHARCVPIDSCSSSATSSGTHLEDLVVADDIEETDDTPDVGSNVRHVSSDAVLDEASPTVESTNLCSTLTDVDHEETETTAVDCDVASTTEHIVHAKADRTLKSCESLLIDSTPVAVTIEYSDPDLSAAADSNDPGRCQEISSSVVILTDAPLKLVEAQSSVTQVGNSSVFERKTGPEDDLSPPADSGRTKETEPSEREKSELAYLSDEEKQMQNLCRCLVAAATARLLAATSFQNEESEAAMTPDDPLEQRQSPCDSTKNSHHEGEEDRTGPDAELLQQEEEEIRATPTSRGMNEEFFQEMVSQLSKNIEHCQDASYLQTSRSGPDAEIHARPKEAKAEESEDDGKSRNQTGIGGSSEPVAGIETGMTAQVLRQLRRFWEEQSASSGCSKVGPLLTLGRETQMQSEAERPAEESVDGASPTSASSEIAATSVLSLSPGTPTIEIIKSPKPSDVHPDGEPLPARLDDPRVCQEVDESTLDDSRRLSSAGRPAGCSPSDEVTNQESAAKNDSFQKQRCDENDYDAVQSSTLMDFSDGGGINDRQQERNGQRNGQRNGSASHSVPAQMLAPQPSYSTSRPVATAKEKMTDARLCDAPTSHELWTSHDNTLDVGHKLLVHGGNLRQAPDPPLDRFASFDGPLSPPFRISSEETDYSTDTCPELASLRPPPRPSPPREEYYLDDASYYFDYYDGPHPHEPWAYDTESLPPVPPLPPMEEYFLDASAGVSPPRPPPRRALIPPPCPRAPSMFRTRSLSPMFQQNYTTHPVPPAEPWNMEYTRHETYDVDSYSSSQFHDDERLKAKLLADWLALAKRNRSQSRTASPSVTLRSCSNLSTTTTSETLRCDSRDESSAVETESEMEDHRKVLSDDNEYRRYLLERENRKQQGVIRMTASFRELQLLGQVNFDQRPPRHMSHQHVPPMRKKLFDPADSSCDESDGCAGPCIDPAAIDLFSSSVIPKRLEEDLELLLAPSDPSADGECCSSNSQKHLSHAPSNGTHQPRIQLQRARRGEHCNFRRDWC